MKVSIITVSYNSEDTIEDAINSVLSQTYDDIEYIIVDGGSNDETLDIIEKYKDNISKVNSGPDRGIYDAMNKGIDLANGEVIGFLNSDDLYADNNVISKVIDTIKKNMVDCCWGNLVYVAQNNIDKIIRYWESSEYKKGKFKTGWMPPHPTFFAKKEVYDKYGNFDLDFPISADYEIMLRFLEKYRIKSSYIPEVLVKMRAGGNSSPSVLNTLKANIECYKACKKNGINPGLGLIFKKPASKLNQFFKRK